MTTSYAWPRRDTAPDDTVFTIAEDLVHGGFVCHDTRGNLVAAGETFAKCEDMIRRRQRAGHLRAGAVNGQPPLPMEEVA